MEFGIHYTEPTSSLIEFIQNAEHSINVLKSVDYEIRTLQAWVTAICAVFKHASCSTKFKQIIKDQWKTFHKELDTKVTELESHNLRSEHEESAKITLEEALTKEKLLSETERGSQVHLLVAWHCLWPPNRGGDCGIVYFVKDKKESEMPEYSNKNVLIYDPNHSESIFLLRNHKTAKYSGTITRKLPQKLKEIVDASMSSEHGYGERKCLFISSQNGNPYLSEKTFMAWANRMFQQLFQKPVTVNSFRHAFVNALDFQRMSTVKLEAVAKSMGHTLRTQQRSYKRIEKDDHDSEIIFR